MKRQLILPASLAVLIVAGALAGLLLPQTAAAACPSLPSSLGTTSLTLNVESAGTYRVWVRELAPTATTGFYLQVPDAGACQITMGNAAIPANAWTWVDYQNASTANKVDVNLSAGNHPVTLAGLASGVEVDRLLLLTDTSCTPTGDGSNCTAVSAAVATPTPSGSPGTSPQSHSIPGNANAPVNTNPVSNLVAAAGRFRNPLLFAGMFIVAIPLLWFAARHLGLIHPDITPNPAELDFPDQPRPHPAPPAATTKPQTLPSLPETPPAPQPGSTTAPSSNPSPGTPPTNIHKD